MFKFWRGKKKIVLHANIWRAEEKLRQALEVLLGKRIEFSDIEVSLEKEGHDPRVSLRGSMMIFESATVSALCHIEAVITICHRTFGLKSAYFTVDQGIQYEASWNYQGLPDGYSPGRFIYFAPVTVTPLNQCRAHGLTRWSGTSREDRQLSEL